MNASQLFIAFYTLVRKEFTRVLRIWPQTILPPAITAGLYFLIFGTVIGDRIGLIHGFPYIEFIVPGIVMSSLINSSFMNTSFSFYSSKFNHSIEEIQVSPMPNHLIIWGYVSGGILRGVLVGAMVFAISAFFTHVLPAHPMFCILTAMLSSTLFSMLGLINGMLANNFDDVSWIPSFIITPLTYLGGVFYSIESLPTIWQQISLFNPIVYIVSAFRFSILGNWTANSYLSIVCILLLNAILYVMTLKIMDRSIK
jgi:ABC-2 type transport system permease protein